MYPVYNVNRVVGAAIPVGWKIIYDAQGNPVYVKDRA